MRARRIFSQRDRIERGNPRHAQVFRRAQIVPAIEQHPQHPMFQLPLDRVRAHRVCYRAVLANEN
jgi:hypothetical protein